MGINAARLRAAGASAFGAWRWLRRFSAILLATRPRYDSPVWTALSLVVHLAGHLAVWDDDAEMHKMRQALCCMLRCNLSSEDSGIELLGMALPEDEEMRGLVALPVVLKNVDGKASHFLSKAICPAHLRCKARRVRMGLRLGLTQASEHITRNASPPAVAG